jgi:oligopeptidase B
MQKMLRFAPILTGVSIIALTGLADSSAQFAPPIANVIPSVFTAHGQRRVDNYHWLRDKTDPSVIAYLNAENQYAERRLAPLQPLITELERELQERADHSDSSSLFADSRYIYRRRIAKGAAFPLIVRRARQDTTEQVVLDVERLAAGHSHYELADYVISPDGNSVAYAVDLSGRRVHRIFVRDIATGKITDTGIREAASDLVFSADSKWLFYVRVHPEAVRSYQLWRHRIGYESSQDRLVYEEADATFELHLNRSKSGKYILLDSSQQQTSEVRYLPAAQPEAAPMVMEPRRRGVIYSADHVGETFYVRTNLHAPDFRLVQAPESAPQAGNWTELVAQTPGRLISEFEVFNSFIALVEEADAIQSVRVLRFADHKMMSVPARDSIGITEIAPSVRGVDQDTAATTLRVRFSGPLHPHSISDFDTLTGETKLHKRAAETWFDASAYAVKRIMAASADGESVPVTVTFRKDKLQPGGNPVLVTGYGAYGTSEAPTFPGDWMSLIDRGFILAQAHVRGGQEKGWRWYQQGHMLAKHNSFDDFIAATEALIVQGYADPRRVFAHGASAGGLLVAVAVNRRPDLYAGVVADVPFVDVITTMSDPGVPLTTLEYEEWGNPAIKQHFDAMMSYSPYDNVTAQPYPPMFITAALNDSQVGFHEPAKWVARLRATKTDNNKLLFLTSMNSGHSGKPGRFGPHEQSARIMAWLIAQSDRPR